MFHYDDLLFGFLKLNDKLWTGYLALQGLLHHSYCSSFDETLAFVEFLSQKLKDTKSELLSKAGQTYHKWRYEIANAFAKDAKQKRWTDSIAECINNQLKTAVKSAYGYHDFEAFGKRAMPIITYSEAE